MEWISEEDYKKLQENSHNAEKAKIEAQIAELQAKLKNM